MRTGVQHTADRLPVSVVMERRLARSGRWTEYQWECVDVITGQAVVQGEVGSTLVSDDGERARFVWSGFSLALYKDACESYWHNLQNEAPYLFVICFHDEGAQDDSMAVQPAMVTADQSEANSHLDSVGLVFSVPMPPRVIDWMERFVVEHYAPVEKKKRKRRNWAEESEEHAKARRPDRTH